MSNTDPNNNNTNPNTNTNTDTDNTASIGSIPDILWVMPLFVKPFTLHLNSFRLNECGRFLLCFQRSDLIKNVVDVVRDFIHSVPCRMKVDPRVHLYDYDTLSPLLLSSFYNDTSPDMRKLLELGTHPSSFLMSHNVTNVSCQVLWDLLQAKLTKGTMFLFLWSAKLRTPVPKVEIPSAVHTWAASQPLQIPSTPSDPQKNTTTKQSTNKSGFSQVLSTSFSKQNWKTYSGYVTSLYTQLQNSKELIFGGALRYYDDPGRVSEEQWLKREEASDDVNFHAKVLYKKQEAVVKIRTTNKPNAVYGTAFFVTPNHLITCLHVLYTTSLQPISLDFEVFTAGNWIGPFELRTTKVYPQDDDIDSDLGMDIIILDLGGPVSKSSIPLWSSKSGTPYAWNDSTPDFDITFRDPVGLSKEKRQRVYVMAFPNEANEPRTITHNNTVIALCNFEVFYQNDTFPGYSGAPVIDQFGRLVAVHRRGGLRDDKSKEVFGIGTVPSKRQTKNLLLLKNLSIK